MKEVEEEIDRFSSRAELKAKDLIFKEDEEEKEIKPGKSIFMTNPLFPKI